MNKEVKFSLINKVYLYFYSKTSENTLSYLYIKNFEEAEPEKYGIVSTEVTFKDNNCLFSLSRILTNTFYKLFIDNNLQKVIKGEISDLNTLFLPNNKQLIHRELWNDTVMNYWMDKLSEIIIQYDNIDKIKIFFIELPLLDLNKLNNILQKINYKYSFEYVDSKTISKINLNKNSTEILSKLNLESITQHIKSTEEHIKNNECDLYIILACKKAGESEKGYFHYPSLFKGIYRRNKEDWRYLVTSKNEFPDEEMLRKAKGIILPGSELSVHDDLEFLRNTKDFLVNLINNIEFNGKYPQLKILGICFGFEIIMRGYGAELNEEKWGPQASFGPFKINLQDTFWELEYVKKTGIEKRSSLIINEAHSEKIIKYPPEEKNLFTTLGSSENCECEISVDKNGKILMLQGHPEYSQGLTVSRFLDMIMEFAGIKKEDINEESMDKFEEKFLSLEENRSTNLYEWRAICDSFLRY